MGKITSHGFWKCIKSPYKNYELQEGDVVEAYPLTPVGGVLCIWGPEHHVEIYNIWDTDEWNGHVPVDYFHREGYEFERVLDEQNCPMVYKPICRLSTL